MSRASQFHKHLFLLSLTSSLLTVRLQLHVSAGAMWWNATRCIPGAILVDIASLMWSVARECRGNVSALRRHLGRMTPHPARSQPAPPSPSPPRSPPTPYSRCRSVRWSEPLVDIAVSHKRGPAGLAILLFVCGASGAPVRPDAATALPTAVQNRRQTVCWALGLGRRKIPG